MSKFLNKYVFSNNSIKPFLKSLISTKVPKKSLTFLVYENVDE